LSKLRAIVFFAALLALGAALAACGDSGNADKSPEAVLEEATFEGIESGEVDLSMSVDAQGSGGGHVDVSLSGPFESEGEELPRLDLTAEAKGRMDGEDIDFDGGLVLLPNKAYVSYEGVDYEVDSTTFSFVQSTIEETQQREGGGKQTGVTACQEVAAEKVDIGEFADNLVNDGSADVDGTGTTKVSGDLNVSGAIDAIVELSEEPACKAQLGAAGPLPSNDQVEEAKSEIDDALKQAHVEVFVGDDDIVRRLGAQLTIAPKASGSGPESIDLDFDLTLTGVNEEQSIVAPQKAQRLSKLFIELGINPIELIGLLSGEGLGGAGLGGLLGGLGDLGPGGGQTYTECLQAANSAADIQRCGAKLR
jgi:hypothetical protein